MTFRTKEIFAVLLIFFSVCAVKSQVANSSPSSPVAVDDNDFVCGLTRELIEIDVSVWSGKQGFLKDLTYKDFVVYDEKEKREIEFFKFDDLTNQYKIGFTQTEFFAKDTRWRKIKVKLVAVKKDYGKISITAPNGYYPKLF